MIDVVFLIAQSLRLTRNKVGLYFTWHTALTVQLMYVSFNGVWAVATGPTSHHLSRSRPFNTPDVMKALFIDRIRDLD